MKGMKTRVLPFSDILAQGYNLQLAGSSLKERLAFLAGLVPFTQILSWLSCKVKETVLEVDELKEVRS